MAIGQTTLNTRLRDLTDRFSPMTAELHIRVRSDLSGAVALREAIFAEGKRDGPLVLPSVENLRDVGAILARTPAAERTKNAAIAVFDPQTPDARLEQLQSDVADAIVTGVIGLGAAGGDARDLDAQVDALLDTVLSADPTSHQVRDLLSGGRTGGQPDIPRELLERLEKLQSSNCYAGIRQAMAGLAAAVMSATTAADRQPLIESIEPADAAPGSSVVITGAGFGTSQDDQVVWFTGAHHTPSVEGVVRDWAETTIAVIVPDGAGRGPVRIARPDRRGGDGVAGAAGELAGEMSMCLGAGASGAVRVLEKLAHVELSPLSASATFSGGPPEIRSFSLAGRVGDTIWPGGSLTLEWTVDGADSITITPEQVGGAPNELPTIPSGLPAGGGSHTVANIAGTSNWTGAYRLVATNKSGTHEMLLDVVMARRVGFALSGGGSRGAFQIGALDYLYNVKGVRPDAIASTSVGSVNALQLIMGDTSSKSAIEQLKDIWLGLEKVSDMWIEEPWLTNAKQAARDAISSFGWWDLALFPVTLPIHAVDIKSKIDSLNTTLRSGVDSFFNLSPIEDKMRATFDPARAAGSGIDARFIATSLKTGEVVKVDEQGNVLASGGGMASAIDGAMASSIMPGIFPARTVGAHPCVDGGIREIIPVQYCIDDMGTNVVYAVACSAKTQPDTRQKWSMIDVMARSMMDINFDEIVEDDVTPHGGWPDGVVVHSIFPRLNVFDPIMIEPGLIRIALDYGWMCAADELDTPDHGKAAARLAADKIVQLRLQNWADRYQFENVMTAPDPNSGFLPAIVNGFMPPSRPPHSKLVRSANWYEPFLQALRDQCRQVHTVAAERLAAGGALPPGSASWWQGWETVAKDAQFETGYWGLTTPWQGMSTLVAAATPPPVL